MIDPKTMDEAMLLTDLSETIAAYASSPSEQVRAALEAVEVIRWAILRRNTQGLAVHCQEWIVANVYRFNRANPSRN